MRYSEFVDALVSRTGIEHPVHVRRAIRATLEALGERFTRAEAEALARELPDELAAIVREAEHVGEMTVEEFYGRVTKLEAVEAAFAIEHAQVVCQLLTEMIPEALALRIRKTFQADIGPLFNRALPRKSVPPPSRVPPGEGRTLASGRPHGSAHPLAESAPVQAHGHSVAASSSPHADTKLSSSRGLTQEREKESFAEGKPPGSGRAIADTSD